MMDIYIGKVECRVITGPCKGSYATRNDDKEQRWHSIHLCNTFTRWFKYSFRGAQINCLRDTMMTHFLQSPHFIFLCRWLTNLNSHLKCCRDIAQILCSNPSLDVFSKLRLCSHNAAWISHFLVDCFLWERYLIAELLFSFHRTHTR